MLPTWFRGPRLPRTRRANRTTSGALNIALRPFHGRNRGLNPRGDAKLSANNATRIKREQKKEAEGSVLTSDHYPPDGVKYYIDQPMGSCHTSIWRPLNLQATLTTGFLSHRNLEVSTPEFMVVIDPDHGCGVSPQIRLRQSALRIRPLGRFDRQV